MKKKILIISSVALLILICVLLFFLIKGNPFIKVYEEPEEYDVSHIVEDIEFMKISTYDDLKSYADEYPIYIQTSDDDTIFGVGELYIEEVPVRLIYSLNEDGSINRFDGEYSVKLEKSSTENVQNIVSTFECIIQQFFALDYFEHSIYDENGMKTDSYGEDVFEKLLQGKSSYSLTVVDYEGTYWSVTAVVEDKKTMKFDFFRCFDLSLYGDDDPDVDLRVVAESEVEINDDNEEE
ncbi:MAG: hypothetical protein IJD93_00745 [Ruminococcus sp.]|nr:hypothetical protein [Ruminococcus sp.]